MAEKENSILRVGCVCPKCKWIGQVKQCEPDVDGDGSIGCPKCFTVVKTEIDNCPSCESLKEKYSHTMDRLKDALEENEKLKKQSEKIIIDAVKREEKIMKLKKSDWTAIIITLVILQILSLWCIDVSISAITVREYGIQNGIEASSMHLTNGFFQLDPVVTYHISLFWLIISLFLIALISIHQISDDR